MAYARALASPTRTSRPPFPSSSISVGPLGHRVETIGSLSDIASVSTQGKPSHTDDIASKSERAMYRHGFR